MNVQTVAGYRDQKAALIFASVRLFDQSCEHGVSGSRCGESVPIILQCKLIRNLFSLPNCCHSGNPVVDDLAQTHHHFTS